MKIVFIILVVIIAFLAYVFIPPKELAVSRIEFIPSALVEINNDFYNEPEFAQNWLDEQQWASGLHAMNPTRVSYVFDRIIEQFKIKDSVKWASIACGGGILELALEKRIHDLLRTDAAYKNKSFEIVGVDQSENSIATANAAKKTEMSRFIVGNAYKVPLPDNSYDGVIVADILEHLNDLPTAVQEIYRILKKEKTSEIVYDTITRSFPAYVALIALGEGMGLIPPHTHDYRLFIKPEELIELLKKFN